MRDISTIVVVVVVAVVVAILQPSFVFSWKISTRKTQIGRNNKRLHGVLHEQSYYSSTRINYTMQTELSPTLTAYTPAHQIFKH